MYVYVCVVSVPCWIKPYGIKPCTQSLSLSFAGVRGWVIRDAPTPPVSSMWCIGHWLTDRKRGARDSQPDQTRPSEWECLNLQQPASPTRPPTPTDNCCHPLPWQIIKGICQIKRGKRNTIVGYLTELGKTDEPFDFLQEKYKEFKNEEVRHVTPDIRK